MLRKIFGSKREEVTGEGKRLHIEEVHNLYSLPNIIGMVKSRRMRWARHVARMGEKGRGFWSGNLRTGHHLGGLGGIQEDNIKMDLKISTMAGLGLIHMTQDSDMWRAVVNTVMKFRTP